MGGETTEKHVDFVTKTKVRRPLTDVKENLRLPLAGIAAVELDNSIFEGEPAEAGLERLLIEHQQVEPQLRRSGLRCLPFFAQRFVRGGAAGTTLEDGEGIRADRTQCARGASFV